ncbi:MAG: metal ABC transporter permease [Syntrophorhabdus sp.]|nr:metal ABC transporter permease [Pseudomonadota bacterium]HNQ45881.1 metal ABC transporter permease [Syntrophorhabdus sp.]HNS79439.1 metal ABC transporter permease [Syntrophorhabdus sp.]HOD77520.1 metal ABC transporter permease [Syntrophorhabdus sp.]HPW36746.1 metal ABC transporter permease [Syntrophorhabdus sp.]
MDIINLLSHGFIQRALMAGSFIAILCATLGTFLVLRRFSLIGDGLAHVTFGGVAVGLFLNVYPIYAAVPVAMISSLGILKLVEKARVYGDAAIGIVSSLGIACGILLASVSGGFNIDLFSYLFGNILAISNAEVISSIFLSLILMSVIWYYYHELLSITFDEESARASGIKTKTINGILVLLTSLTVVLAMRVVGIMLISSLLILPPVTALQIARGFKMTIVIASVSGVLSIILGIFFSLVFDLPSGATIVILNFLLFVCSFVYGRLLVK